MLFPVPTVNPLSVPSPCCNGGVYGFQWSCHSCLTRPKGPISREGEVISGIHLFFRRDSDKTGLCMLYTLCSIIFLSYVCSWHVENCANWISKSPKPLLAYTSWSALMKFSDCLNNMISTRSTGINLFSSYCVKNKQNVYSYNIFILA